MMMASITLDGDTDPVVLRVTGRLLTVALGAVERAMPSVPSGTKTLKIDLSDVEAMDTGGAWLLADLGRKLEAEGCTVEITGATETQQALLKTVTDAIPDEELVEAPARGLIPFLDRFGRRTVGTGEDIVSLLGFFGLILVRLVGVLVRPWRLRAAALFTHMEETGLKAVPIVVLMGFMIGVVLAFQGAAQLSQFGAEVYVVDLIAYSVLRELGILLTAIIVAGRSGSAFTASVGSMKLQQEIDAMETLGLDPIEVLVVPRVLALLIMLPVLGFIANIAGLVGGALMSWMDLGVSPGLFVARLYEDIDGWQVGIGMIKAPFFALVIGTIALWQAMQVEGSSVSVGQRTTASVVQSISIVIALDAVFSIFFSIMDL
ncbi:ABC transporter permease [Chachezhania sediminis]|uniref:ABC transporter permease n=1 Tax=Chachezhania sediminis TaxID=2599291 RepID=UPI00131B2799